MAKLFNFRWQYLQTPGVTAEKPLDKEENLPTFAAVYNCSIFAGNSVQFSMAIYNHNLPKAKYPFLATNFFNLVPCCGHCNSTKNSADILFKLYHTDRHNLDLLRFEIDEAKVVRYLTTINRDDIDVHLKDLVRYPAGEKTMAEIFDERFHINSLCKEHRDVIEELLWKYKIYNQSYISMLEQQFSLLFPSDVNFNRFLLGNYDLPEDVHKRPLAKLIQDIARQLDMIM